MAKLVEFRDVYGNIAYGMMIDDKVADFRQGNVYSKDEINILRVTTWWPILDDEDLRDNPYWDPYE